MDIIKPIEITSIKGDKKVKSISTSPYERNTYTQKYSFRKQKYGNFQESLEENSFSAPTVTVLSVGDIKVSTVVGRSIE